jgi:hypothetical protein
MLIEANEKRSLLRAAYMRKFCHWAINEDYFRRELFLVGSLGGDKANATGLRFDIEYIEGGKPARYGYFGDEGRLTLRTRSSWSELLLAEDQVRFRGRNKTGLRLKLRSMVEGKGAEALDSAAWLEDGSVEAAMGKYGYLRFVALEGEMTMNVAYGEETGVCSVFEITVMPGDDGRYDLALLDGDTRVERPSEFKSFEALCEDGRRSLAEFSKNYTAVPARWQSLFDDCAYTVWGNVMKPRGFLKSPMIMMHRNCLSVAMAWQQSYNGMAMFGDPVEGFNFIESLFKYQNPVSGALPVDVSPGGINDGGTQPPLQGFALTLLTRRCGEEFITPEMAAGLLPRFERWVGFWTTWRTAGRGDDLVAINNPNESGWDDASIFVRGFPVSNPDTLALLTECMYACAILARRAGEPEREAEWTRRADAMLKTIVTEFWNGEKFITKYKGEPVESLSLACYQPILLGDRLPKEIARKVAENLLKEGEFLSPVGLCTESMKSPMLHWGWHFTLGRVIGPANMFCAVGLWLAGEKEAARKIAEAWCSNAADRGPRLGYNPYPYYPETGEPADYVVQPHIGDSWSWTSWSAAATLTMLQTVLAEE